MKKIHPIIIVLAFTIAAGVYFIQMNNFMSAEKCLDSWKTWDSEGNRCFEEDEKDELMTELLNNNQEQKDSYKKILELQNPFKKEQFLIVYMKIWRFICKYKNK